VKSLDEVVSQFKAINSFATANTIEITVR